MGQMIIMTDSGKISRFELSPSLKTSVGRGLILAGMAVDTLSTLYLGETVLSQHTNNLPALIIGGTLYGGTLKGFAFSFAASGSFFAGLAVGMGGGILGNIYGRLTKNYQRSTRFTRASYEACNFLTESIILPMAGFCFCPATKLSKIVRHWAVSKTETSLPAVAEAEIPNAALSAMVGTPATAPNAVYN